MSHFCVVVFCKNVDDVEGLLAPYQENNMGDVPEQYLSFIEDEDCDIDEKTGRPGYWENPNKKWDWWQVGGRFAGFLDPDLSKTANISQIKNSDFSPNPRWAEEAEREWDIAVNGSEKTEKEEHWFFFSRKYYLETWKDKANFVSDKSSKCPWAFITPDGVWHEKGRMGWWGFNDATYESILAFRQEWENTINTLPKDYHAVVVDCHI